MDDLGEKLNAVLNDPGQMKRFADMAKSIMGGEAPITAAEEPPAGGLDLGMLKNVMGMAKGGDKPAHRELLSAMKPFLSEKRRGKVDKALRLASIASVAGVVLKNFKEEDGDGEL